jgi:hypothetical protein
LGQNWVVFDYMAGRRSNGRVGDTMVADSGIALGKVVVIDTKVEAKVVSEICICCA